MLYHNLVNSDDDRIAKHIVKAQEISGYEECWFGNAKREGMEIGIELSEDEVKGKSKSVWKTQVKKKIKMAVEKKMEEKRSTSRKMRFLSQKNGSETYLTNTFNEDARMAIKIRLNMVEWVQGNIGKDEGCPLCGEADTTEHVFNCEGSRNISGVTVKNLEEGSRMQEIVEMFERNEKKRRELLIENINMNFMMMHREGMI